jgi:nucleoside-diphosphate-sugar epimerase
MRILVTGHSGYIGSVLVPMLVGAGHEVTGLDSNLFADCTFGDESPAIPAINKDIRDVSAADLEGFEAVVHLAGLSNDPLGDYNPGLTYAINHLAALRLAARAKEVGISRFVFSSSCSNYGAAGDDLLDERGTFNPVTPYGIAKVRAEGDIARLADAGFAPILLRNATVYGVSPRLRFDLVLNNLVAWAFTTGRVYLKSDGTAWRPLVHVQDVARAFLVVLGAPFERVHNQAFNVVPIGENYRIRELAQVVAETVPGSRVEYARDAAADARCYRVDGSKLINTLPEFKPQWDIRKGAAELYTVYQRVGLTLEEFEGPRYKRIAHIQHLLRSGQLDETLRWKIGEPARAEGTYPRAA